MMPKEGEISSYGLTMLATGFLLGSSLLFVPGQAAKQDTWATLTLGMFEGIAVSILYCGLASRFRRRTLPQICVEVYGRYLGAVVGALYLWFLFHLGSLVIGNLDDFVSLTMLVRTPQSAVLAVLVVAGVVVVRYGLGAMTLCAEMTIPYVLIAVFATTLMLLPDYHWTRLEPVLATPIPKLLFLGHTTASFPFNEAAAFMMVLPFVRGKPRPTAMTRPLLLAGLFLVIGAVRNTAALGALGAQQVYQSYAAVRLIDLMDVFTRLEISWRSTSS
jgi:spore germination protein KB